MERTGYSGAAEIVERARGLITRPAAEWQTIAAEQSDIRTMFTGYAMVLAAIPPVASFIGFSLIGVSFGTFTFRLPVGRGLAHSIVQYILSLVAIYVLGWLISVLAPKFQGEADLTAGVKVAVYTGTAAWLAGVFSLIPALSVLGILGLYSLYLLYVGLPIVTRCPEGKALSFVITIAACSILVWIVAGLLVAGLVSTGAPILPGVENGAHG